MSACIGWAVMAFLFGGAAMFFLMVGMLYSSIRRKRSDLDEFIAEWDKKHPRTSTSSIKHQSGPAPDFADDDERRDF